MAEWFRNTHWNDEIAAAFDARLGRARDKAQYLNIQAYTLLATHPPVAAALCRRTLALNDPAQTARAGLYLGTALAVEGDFDGAIDALEASIASERRHPMHRTGAYADQALLVAWAKRSDLYETVLSRLEERHGGQSDELPISALIAKSLIQGERGEADKDLATAALSALEELDWEPSVIPTYLSIDLIKGRLRSICEVESP